MFKKIELPPAPSIDMTIKVPLEILPEWLDAHQLAIVGWDRKFGTVLMVSEKHLEKKGGERISD